jgi:selenide,water dikinase
VTGFGLLGHLHELALASGCAAEIDGSALPAIEGVLELLAGEAALAGGSRRNRADAERFVTWAESVPEPLRWLACDAMTSGGLLVAGAGVDGWPIGRLVGGEPGQIRVG